MALNCRVVGPNGRLDVGLSINKTIYSITRSPLKFNLLTQNEATLGELGRADIPITVNGKIISVSSDGQPLNGRAQRSLLIHAFEDGFWNIPDGGSSHLGRVKLPGYTRSLGGLDGTSPTGQAETTLVLGYRCDPTGWSSTYNKFPNLNTTLTSGATSLSLLNATQAPLWTDGNATDRAFNNIKTTSGSAVIEAVNSALTTAYLAPFTQLDELAGSLITNDTGTGIPGSTTIASVQSPTKATMSQNATVTETITARIQGGLMLIEDEVIAFRTLSRASDAATTVSNLTRGAFGTRAAEHAASSQVFFLIPWEVYGMLTSASIDWDAEKAEDVEGVNAYGFTMNFIRGNVVVTVA